MSLYAVDDGELIQAADAQPNQVYSCADCFGPVKMRQGRTFHFYHLKTTPSCRLYSKSEHHLLAQLELQRLFPKGALELEKPFPSIHRIADVCWEQEKIIFEIQCSLISELEAASRMRDYSSIGYWVIWLLYDKQYNRQFCRPAERFLRSKGAYFFKIAPFFKVYDQFESFAQEERIQKSRPFPVDLRKGKSLQFLNPPPQKITLYQRIIGWFLPKTDS